MGPVKIFIRGLHRRIFLHFYYMPLRKADSGYKSQGDYSPGDEEAVL
jgi:hypothetical protein